MPCELLFVQQCVQQPGRTAVRIGAFIGDLSPPIRVRTACQCMGMHDYCQNPRFGTNDLHSFGQYVATGERLTEFKSGPFQTQSIARTSLR